MRNHWINVSVDGRKNDIEAGPKAKSGEMKITLAQRVEGVSVEVLEVECFPITNQDGEELVCTRATNKMTGEIVFYYESKR